MKHTLKNWSLGFGEAWLCLGLALRDARHAGLWWRSALWCTVVVGLWLGLYIGYGKFFLELAARLAMVSVAGLLGLGLMSGIGSVTTGAPTISQMGSFAGSLGGMAQTMLSIGQFVLVLLALAGFFYVLVFIVGAISTARLPLRWLFLARARDVVARRYPQWQLSPEAAAAVSKPSWFKRILLVLSLLIPVWAMLVVVATLLAWNVWFIYGAAADGVLDADQQKRLRQAQRPAIYCLGLLLCLTMLVPVLNLLLPALLCLSVCHLQRRGWVAPRRQA